MWLPRLTEPPRPASEPMVWLVAAERSRLVPTPSVIAPVGDRLPPAPSANAPPARLKAPVSELAPFKVSVPAPFLVTLPAPEIEPLNVSALLPSRFSEPPPLTTRLLPRLKPAVVSSEALPPTVRLPMPSAPAFPSTRPPALRLTPPENRFAPPSVTMPVLLTVSPPVPDSTPPRLNALVPPRERLPPRLKALVRFRPAVEAAMAPPLAVNSPVPKEPALLKLTRPSLSVVVPAPAHAPCRFQVPLLTVSLWKLMYWFQPSVVTAPPVPLPGTVALFCSTRLLLDAEPPSTMPAAARFTASAPTCPATPIPAVLTLEPDTAVKVLPATELPRFTLPLMVPALRKVLPAPAVAEPWNPMRPVMVPVLLRVVCAPP